MKRYLSKKTQVLVKWQQICIPQRPWPLFLVPKCVQNKAFILNKEEAIYICINREGIQMDKPFNNCVHNYKTSLNWPLISHDPIWLSRKEMQK